MEQFIAFTKILSVILGAVSAAIFIYVFIHDTKHNEEKTKITKLWMIAFLLAMGWIGLKFLSMDEECSLFEGIWFVSLFFLDGYCAFTQALSLAEYASEEAHIVINKQDNKSTRNTKRILKDHPKEKFQFTIKDAENNVETH